MVIPLKLIDQAAGPDRSLSFMSWCVGVIVFPMMLIYFQIKRLSKCALKRVACPTLVLCGRQDALTPVALHEEIAAGIRGAKLVVERSGHLSPLEQPDVVSAVLRRWLAE
jgi:pimeloyl-ACP methyl ester carboxylesterase